VPTWADIGSNFKPKENGRGERGNKVGEIHSKKRPIGPKTLQISRLSNFMTVK
jgi:hypothetical protein